MDSVQQIKVKMQPAWSQNDELFISELKAGHEWQMLAACFFKLHGFEVEVPELSIRNSIKQAGNWISSVDLLLNGKKIEIKSRNEVFSSPQSFPYDTIFVDTVSGYDAKAEKPLAYIMISRPTGCMLCLRSDKPNAWKIEEKFDRVRKIKEKFYVCDKKYLQTLDCLVGFLKK